MRRADLPYGAVWAVWCDGARWRKMAPLPQALDGRKMLTTRPGSGGPASKKSGPKPLGRLAHGLVIDGVRLVM